MPKTEKVNPDTGEVAEVEVDAASLAKETLTGDLRDIMLSRVKTLTEPWAKLSEDGQRTIIQGVEWEARQIVRRVVELIAAEGRKVVKAKLEQVVFKDGIKAVVTCSGFDPNRHELADATGETVLVVLADVEQYTGERAPAEPDPDEPELPVSEAAE